MLVQIELHAPGQRRSGSSDDGQIRQITLFDYLVRIFVICFYRTRVAQLFFFFFYFAQFRSNEKDIQAKKQRVTGPPKTGWRCRFHATAAAARPVKARPQFTDEHRCNLSGTVFNAFYITTQGVFVAGENTVGWLSAEDGSLP